MGEEKKKSILWTWRGLDGDLLQAKGLLKVNGQRKEVEGRNSPFRVLENMGEIYLQPLLYLIGCR